MDEPRKSTLFFNRIPISVLSTIFALTQNPEVALLNRRLHHVTQNPWTIANYVLHFAERCAEGGPEDHIYFYLDSILKKYPRAHLVDRVGEIILSGIPKLNYMWAISRALEHNWNSAINRLFEMFILINRDTGKIIYKHAKFLNNKSSNIDTQKIKLQIEEPAWRYLQQIDVSESVYALPLIATKSFQDYLKSSKDVKFYTRMYKGLLNLVYSRLELPTAWAGRYKEGLALTDCKYVLIYLAFSVIRAFGARNFRAVNALPYTDMNLTITPRDIETVPQHIHHCFQHFFEFLLKKKYNRSANIQTILTFYAIKYDGKKSIKTLVKNKSQTLDLRMLLNMATFLSKSWCVRSVIRLVELDEEKLYDIGLMMLNCHDTAGINHIIRSQASLSTKMAELMMHTAFTARDIGSIKLIASKCEIHNSKDFLTGAIYTNNIVALRLYLEAGGNITKYQGAALKIAVDNGEIKLLRAALKDNPGETVTESMIRQLCTSIDSTILDSLIKDFTRIEELISNSDIHDSYNRALSFGKTLEFLITTGLGLDHFCFKVIFKQIMMGNMDKVKCLLEKGVIFDGIKSPSKKALKIRRMLLKIASLIANKSNSNSCTASYGNRKVVRLTTDDIRRLTANYILDNRFEYIYSRDIDMVDRINAIYVSMNSPYLESSPPKDQYFKQMKSKVVTRNFETLKVLLENTAAVDSGYNLILSAAYQYGNKNWIQYFVDHGKRHEIDKRATMHSACKSNRLNSLKMYFSNGGRMITESGLNGITIACGLSNLRMVQMLVEKGADLNDSKCNGITEAVNHNNMEIIKYLIANDASIDGLENILLETACLNGDFELVGLVAKRKHDMRKIRHNRVLWFCVSNSPEVALTLLSFGLVRQSNVATVKSGKSTSIYDCIYQAVLNNNYEMITLLMRFTNDNSTRSLLYKIKEVMVNKDIKRIGLLIEQSGEISIDYNYGLFSAYQNGDFEILQMVVRRGLGLRVNDSALVNCICKTNNTHLLRHLLKHANLVLYTKNRGLSEAYRNKSIEMMKLLITHRFYASPDECLALRLAYKLNSFDFAVFLSKFKPRCSKNFVRKLKRIVIGNRKKTENLTNKRYRIAKYMLSYLLPRG
ncbi:putative ankyrin repeat protein [Zancudomyces culisetae]|uniref:Putative ankyrin repeat protein n=1 Tax=Zancudomyces culisetae TaxID=1213189 RepID=A0A1R1PPE0_ZANCU|nr:putative ankyrin repeat protein [Zancudomyces culisetae]|eukprot:OMH82828.1 putative ankyrin repeat protein [Zancudomyces culisetae]